MKEKFIYKDLSYKIIGSAMQVHTELGFGFLEKVYENALMVMFEENLIKAEQQVPIKVRFHERIVGSYVADILVDDSIILELKAQESLRSIHKAQTLNYLKATNLKLGILLNFGRRKLEYERLIF